jgi:hypothetical protein
VFAGAVSTLAASITLGTAWWTRRRASRTAEQRLTEYEGTFAAIVSLAEEYAARDVPQTRVEAEPQSEAVSEEAEPARAEAAVRR